MKEGTVEVDIVAVSKFHQSLYISGTYQISRPAGVEIRFRHFDGTVLGPVFIHNDVEQFGRSVFSAQMLIENIRVTKVAVSFWRAEKLLAEFSLQDLAQERLASYRSQKLGDEFVEQVKASSGVKVLDLGGRDRSRTARRELFGDADCVVFDILSGDNVDVVGDAHHLSAHFARGKFDFVYCISVFEHLLMPWKVVIEMNKVMKKGARAFISTHQTVGVHDMPWDFWRFSIWSWEALFNRFTGFKIVDREMDMEQFVIPFVFRPGKEDAEKSAGYEASVVLVEKIGPPLARWWVPLRKILSTSYPE